MNKLTSQCWYVSATRDRGRCGNHMPVVHMGVCEDISFYSYESLLQHLDLTQASVCVFLHQLHVCMCIQLKETDHFHQ